MGETTPSMPSTAKGKSWNVSLAVRGFLICDDEFLAGTFVQGWRPMGAQMRGALPPRVEEPVDGLLREHIPDPAQKPPNHQHASDSCLR